MRASLGTALDNMEIVHRPIQPPRELVNRLGIFGPAERRQLRGGVNSPAHRLRSPGIRVDSPAL